MSVKNVASKEGALADAPLILLPELARHSGVTEDAVRSACKALGITPVRTPSRRRMVSITTARRIYAHVRPEAGP